MDDSHVRNASRQRSHHLVGSDPVEPSQAVRQLHQAPPTVSGRSEHVVGPWHVWLRSTRMIRPATPDDVDAGGPAVACRVGSTATPATCPTHSWRIGISSPSSGGHGIGSARCGSRSTTMRSSASPSSTVTRSTSSSSTGRPAGPAWRPHCSAGPRTRSAPPVTASRGSPSFRATPGRGPSTREGWRDAGTFAHLADTADGTIEVPSHRYEIDLVDP